VSDHADLLILGETIATMNAERLLLSNGAIAVVGDRIVAVGAAAELSARFEARETIGGAETVIIPGLINAHQHLTGDRLIRSTIPDNLALGPALTEWALPSHAAHTADDDELSATLGLVEAVTNGITFTLEAGTVAHPERVLAAFDAVGVGGTLGSWGWDVGDGPGSGTLAETLSRQAETLSLTGDSSRVHGWVTLVGHDLMSDELLVAASELARSNNTGMTFHISPSTEDAVSYLARTGVRPLEHMSNLDVLGDHVLLAHALHVDEAEMDVIIENDVAVASCPWAYLRLGQGVTSNFQHPHLRSAGVRVALGCDSENAGDAVDVLLAARLFAGLAKDTTSDPTAFSSQSALAMATIEGARALGLEHDIGSLEVGKRADIVVVDSTGPSWTPHAVDPTINLVWASDGRSVRDVVASGRVVVRDGACVTVDLERLANEARVAHDRLVSSCGAHSRNQ
jgi:5-methylthioadenosine/S-adenosylhomocysteine deaminase